MRLGIETGSLQNTMMARGTKDQPDPVVGMGATILLWTDRHAATIASVEKTSSGKWFIGVQRDRVTVTKGSEADGSADYAYSRIPDAPVRHWRYDGASGWRQVVKNERGRWILAGGEQLMIGVRREYRDPSF